MEKVAEQGQAIAAAVEGIEHQLGADIPGTRKDMHHIFHTVIPTNKGVRFITIPARSTLSWYWYFMDSADLLPVMYYSVTGTSVPGN